MLARRKYQEDRPEESRIVDLGLYRRRLEELDAEWVPDEALESPEEPVRSGRVVDLEGNPVEPAPKKGAFLRKLREWSRWFLDVAASVCVALMTLALAIYVLAF